MATAVALLAGIGIGAAPASAAGNYGEKIFSIGDQSFQATDSNGHFTAQVTYVSGGRPFRENPVAFSFVISPYLKSIATSNMNCTAWQQKNGASTGASDNHPSIGPGYVWHWTFPQYNSIGANMMASGNCTFRVDVAGRTGTANVTFVFRYVVGDGGGDAVTKSDGKALTSKVAIR
ncbi:hypothetical protein ACFV2H_43450 [Streptomyces sp. NPDC059629]|uniref:hypothetical protein n=1 Tax=Streptomyces sp. NPDC059629 TaxID=3346889 RepID=UPI00367AE4E4